VADVSPQPDDVDLALLRTLRDDGRASISSLARDLHLSRSAVHQRLNALVDSRCLLGFTPIVDPSKLGVGVAAFVLISAGPGSRLEMQPLTDQLLGLPHVEYAALVTGDHDVLLLVRVSDLDELRRFLLDELTAITGMRGTLTLLVLDEVIRRPFLLPGE
jgi:Lrp/AsnC family transcriptional regulator, leucine-responsive regulatory protein